MNYHRLFLPNSMVFLTIVTSKRRNILIDNIPLLKTAFKKSIDNYNYNIYAVCIMPDHLHMIIKPFEIKDYPNIVKQFKTYFSKNIDVKLIKNYRLTQSKIDKQERDIWQRRYYEHTIRDENDLIRHTDYIHYNPVKHGLVKSPDEWQFSSFSKFVKAGLYEKEWCNFNDKFKINDLNLE